MGGGELLTEGEPPADVTILFVTSAGGHLAQLVQLAPWWRRQRRAWVTFDLPDARSLLDGERVHHAFYPTTRNIPNLLRNLRLAARVLRQERPDVIVSTGAGVAFPFFVLGRLMGCRTVYIEVVDRIETSTMTGRLCHPFTDLFLVQWPDQLALYDHATLVGRLL